MQISGHSVMQAVKIIIDFYIFLAVLAASLLSLTHCYTFCHFMDLYGSCRQHGKREVCVDGALYSL